MSKFFSKLKGQKDQRDDLQPDQSPSFSSNNPYQNAASQPPAYEPPPGPPPTQVSTSKQTDTASNAVSDENPPPYHDWTSVPDNALLPPPPALTNEHSSTTNASYDEAAAAHAWCARNPVFTPSIPNAVLVETVQAGQHDLDCPLGFRGTLTKLNSTSDVSSFIPNALGAPPSTVFRLSSIVQAPHSAASKSRFLHSSKANQAISTQTQDQDQTFLTRLPLYFAATSSLLSPHFSLPKSAPTTIYFEIKPLKFSSAGSTVAIGFASKPYPTNRQPGWHRACLAVHSDDGNRYVNDAWGGKAFTSAFRAGETLGLAMVVLPEASEITASAKKTSSDREVRSRLPKCKTKVFFVRDGVVQGGWDVDEERDAERDEGIAGLMGEVDLYAAVGIFGGVEVEVRLFEGGEGFVAPPGA